MIFHYLKGFHDEKSKQVVNLNKKIKKTLDKLCKVHYNRDRKRERGESDEVDRTEKIQKEKVVPMFQ